MDNVVQGSHSELGIPVGLLGFRSSQILGLIKVVMMAKKEQEETTPDDNDQVTGTKTILKN